MSRVGQSQGQNRTLNVLFLQGHPSTFGRELAAALEQAGHGVKRINFCAGDWFYWAGRPATNYRGAFEEFEVFLKDFVARNAITDIIYYNDCKPYHQVARRVAGQVGINAYVYEFGYLRPDWITLERNGMSGWSHFPDDPEAVKALAARLPDAAIETRFHNSVLKELTNEIFYNLSTLFLFPLFPKYRSDWYYNPLIEYISGIPRQLMLVRNEGLAARTIDELCRSDVPYFVVPLQLQNDYQLRQNSTYAHQGDAIREVVASFSKAAPGDAQLVFKCHPLDNGAEGWPRTIADATRAHGLGGRVKFIDGGDLKRLLQRARGVVTINSTVGMHALITGCPVKILGTAVFDIPGLTDQGHLDQFWQQPVRPDQELVDALVRALAHTVQVKGSFFDKAGRKAAVAVFVERLTENAVNGHGAFVASPPRLTRGRARAERN